MAPQDRILTDENAEEIAKASLYRHYSKIYEKNHLGQTYDERGQRADTIRSRLLVGFGAGVVIFAFGTLQGEAFIAGIGFLPMVVFGGWLFARWRKASEARERQLEIVKWFEAKGVPFPYENAADIIDPLERLDWEDAQKKSQRELDVEEREQRRVEHERFMKDSATIASLKEYGAMMIAKAKASDDPETRAFLLKQVRENPSTYGLTVEEIDEAEHGP